MNSMHQSVTSNVTDQSPMKVTSFFHNSKVESSQDLPLMPNSSLAIYSNGIALTIHQKGFSLILHPGLIDTIKQITNSHDRVALAYEGSEEDLNEVIRQSYDLFPRGHISRQSLCEHIMQAKPGLMASLEFCTKCGLEERPHE